MPNLNFADCNAGAQNIQAHRDCMVSAEQSACVQRGEDFPLHSLKCMKSWCLSLFNLRS